MSSKDLPSASKTLGEPDPTAKTSSGSMQSPGGMHSPVSREDDTHRVRPDRQFPEPKEFQGTAASAAAPSQPRSDFASYGSLDQGRRSPDTDSLSIQHGREDRMRGRSRGRRNPPLNSPHRPDHIAPSQPISPDARYTRGRSRPERPSVSPETRTPIIIPQPTPVPMYGFPGQAYGGAAMHPHAYPTPGVPPVIPATQYWGPDPFGSRPPRQGRTASDPPSPTGSHSFLPTGQFSGQPYGSPYDAYANPYASYGIPAQPYYYSSPPAVPTSWPEPRYVTVDPFTFNRRRHHEPTHHYVPDGYLRPYIPSVSSPASHPSAPSAGASHPSAPSTGSSSDHSHPNSPPHELPLPASSPSLIRRNRPSWHKRLQSLVKRLLNLILDILVIILQQVYWYLLLRLPPLYFSRVSRVLNDARLSSFDIRRMAVRDAGSPGALLTTQGLPPDATLPPHLLHFRHSWEGFIDSQLRQWETQNYVSALLLAAIITMLQIDAAASDPIARTTAILSLISALMSVLFGSVYIIRFGTMRKLSRAAIWAEEARKGTASILWNVWILLAIPAIWLAWSIILFVTCIMAYTWRTGAAEDPVNTALSNNAALGLRIGVSAVLGVALIYFSLVVITFRKYGDPMDRPMARKWDKDVSVWVQNGQYAAVGAQSGPWEPSMHGNRGRPRMHSRSGSNPVFMHSSRSRSPFLPPPEAHHGRRSSRSERNRERQSRERRERRARKVPPIRFTPAAAFERPFLAAGRGMAPFAAVKMIDLRYMASQKYPLPNFLQSRDILLADWVNFTQDLEDVWNNRNQDIEDGIRPVEIEPAAIPLDVSSRTRAAGLIDRWNDEFFHARFTEAIMCREEPILGHRGYAVYLIHISPDSVGPMPSPHDHDLKSITTIRLVQEPDGRHWVKSTLIIAGPTQQGEDGAHESDFSRNQNKPSTSSSTDSLAYLSIPLPPSPPLDAQATPSPYLTTPPPDETIILHADEQVLSF